MDQIQTLRAEVRRLTEQSATDFQFTMVAMKDMGERFQAQAEALGREMKEGFNQLAGRMKLQEQRVTAVLEAVDHSLQIYENHERRLQTLESRSEPAA
jgi:hypothetical protein